MICPAFCALLSTRIGQTSGPITYPRGTTSRPVHCLPERGGDRPGWALCSGTCCGALGCTGTDSEGHLSRARRQSIETGCRRGTHETETRMHLAGSLSMQTRESPFSRPRPSLFCSLRGLCVRLRGRHIRTVAAESKGQGQDR